MWPYCCGHGCRRLTRAPTRAPVLAIKWEVCQVQICRRSQRRWRASCHTHTQTRQSMPGCFGATDVACGAMPAACRSDSDSSRQMACAGGSRVSGPGVQAPSLAILTRHTMHASSTVSQRRAAAAVRPFIPATHMAHEACSSFHLQPTACHVAAALSALSAVCDAAWHSSTADVGTGDRLDLMHGTAQHAWDLM